MTQRELIELEIREMMRHKWIESEKVGYDLGDAALLDWALRHDLAFVRQAAGAAPYRALPDCCVCC